MATAGYSGTPLLKKPALKEGLKLRLIDPPEDYFQLLKADISSQLCAPKETPDWVHLFAASRKDFEKEMKALKNGLVDVKVPYAPACGNRHQVNPSPTC